MTPSNEKPQYPLRQIKSFVRREGRMTEGQKRGLSEGFPQFGISIDPQNPILNFQTIFGNDHPLTLEIGFGMGDSLIQMAQEAPHVNFIGIEVHRPGIGVLLNHIEEKKLTNIRVMDGDAVEFLKANFPDGSLARVNLFFPDPWHKTRHHKRRIIQPDFLKLVAQKLTPGGVFHAATDWENYAEHMMEVFSASPYFSNLFGDRKFSPDAMDRPETKFERRGVNLGHGVWDLGFFKGTHEGASPRPLPPSRGKAGMGGENSFVLNPTLEADSLFIQNFPLSQCRRMNVKEFPWLILIPRKPDLKDWTDLSFDDQIQLQKEINEAARWLKAKFPCEKLNIANLGNKVSQLHIHIIARTSADVAWPNPVWGVKTTPLSATEI